MERRVLNVYRRLSTKVKRIQLNSNCRNPVFLLATCYVRTYCSVRTYIFKL